VHPGGYSISQLMTSTLPQHHSISVSSFLTSNAVTLHHPLTPSLRSTYASKCVNWLISLRWLFYIEFGEWRHRGSSAIFCDVRCSYRLATVVTELSVITRVLQLPYWTVEGWMTAKMGFVSELGGGEGGTTSSSYQRLQTGQWQFSNS